MREIVGLLPFGNGGRNTSSKKIGDGSTGNIMSFSKREQEGGKTVVVAKITDLDKLLTSQNYNPHFTLLSQNGRVSGEVLGCKMACKLSASEDFITLPHSLIVFDIKKKTIRQIPVGQLEADSAEELFTPDDRLCAMVMSHCPQGDATTLLCQLTSHDYDVFKYRLAHALNACHHENIAHQDVKLPNILKDGHDTLSLSLSDFGFAERFDYGPQSTSTDHIKRGSPIYMSPELFLATVGEECEKTSPYENDVWAMGVCFAILSIGDTSSNKYGKYPRFLEAFTGISTSKGSAILAHKNKQGAADRQNYTDSWVNKTVQLLIHPTGEERA